MDKEINIAFKVDGLDEYITNLDDLKKALGDVETAQDNASESSDKFSNDILDATDKLDALEGGVKVLAGSFEAAAGALSLLGVEDSFLGEIEEHIFGVIALGQGVIDMTEGYRLLAENQKIAAIAQKAFNLAANSNPYVLLASALVAAAGVFITWKLNAEEAIPPTEDLANEIDRLRNQDLQTDLDALATRLANLRKAVTGEEENSELNNAIDLVAELRTKIAEQKEEQVSLTAKFADEENKIALAKYRFAVNLTDEELQKNIESSEALIARLKENGQDYSVEQQVLMGFSAALAERQLQDSIYAMEGQLEEALRYQSTLVNEAVQAARSGATEAVNVAPQLAEALSPLIAQQLEVIKNQKLITDGFAQLPQAAEETTYTTQQIYQRAFNKIREETGESIGELSTQLMTDTANVTNFIGNLSQAFTKDNEKRAERNFKINKAAALAQAVLGTSAAIVEALKAKTLAGRIAQVAFASAAGLAQIANIKRQQYTNLTSPDNVNGPPDENPAAAINYNFGQDAGSAQQIGGQLNQNSQPPLQAYVLASDVTNAQQAQAQIQNLARL